MFIYTYISIYYIHAYICTHITIRGIISTIKIPVKSDLSTEPFVGGPDCQDSSFPGHSQGLPIFWILGIEDPNPHC